MTAPDTRHLVRVTIGLLLAAALYSLTAGLAGAHAALESSDPSANAIVASAPAQVVMRFTEPLEPDASLATLEDAAGRPVAGAQSRIDPSDPYVLLLSVPPDLANGTYTVRWQNVSTADGHPMSGFFAFTIGSTGDQTAVSTAAQPAGGPPYWLITITKWLNYLGLALVVSTWPIWLLVFASALPTGWGSTVRVRRNTLLAGALGLLLLTSGSVLALIVQAWLAMPQAGWTSRTMDVLADTRYGEMWTFRIEATLLFTAISIVAANRGIRALAWLAATVGLLIPLPFSLIAHASAQTAGRTGAITVDWLHLSAAMLWAGGLFHLTVLVWSLRPVPIHILRRTVPRFSVLAIGAWIILALTGSYSAWLLADSRDALTDTAYGKTLLAKLIILGPVLVLAAIHLLSFCPRLRHRAASAAALRFRWSVGIELLLMIGVLLTVGRLVGLQPAGEALSAQRPSGLVRNLDASGHPLRLSISPGAPGPNTYTITVAEAPSHPGVEALLRVTPPGTAQAQSEIRLTRQADGSFAGSGAELARDGEWQVEVIVRQLGVFQWQGEAAVTVVPATTPMSFTSAAWRFDGVGAAGIIGVAAAVIALAGAALVGRRHRPALAGVGCVGLAAGILLMFIGTA